LRFGWFVLVCLFVRDASIPWDRATGFEPVLPN
jgi:hypothetical protein